MSAVQEEIRRQARELRAELRRPLEIRKQWHEAARAEQRPPEGDWRIWYLRGGRGAGKTRTGAETLADWICDNVAQAGEPPREWAICAPTFGDARSVCAEGQSGLIRALGGVAKHGGLVDTWNRSEGVLRLTNGAIVYLDGANDGAFRIQGKNLSGLWADEVGLWEKWDVAWNESIRFAVRMAPSRIVATGTPKMAHPLIKQLLESKNVVQTHMRTVDNEANLDPVALADLLQMYGGSTLGRQELEGEYIEALEGEILRRADWRYYPTENSFYASTTEPHYDRLPAFTQIVHSWDTAVKDKTTADFYSGQVWGISGADRFLLRLFHAHSGFEQAKQAMRELAVWSGRTWPHVATRIVVEAAGLGPDIVKQLEREIQGLRSVPSKGDKVQRVWAASPALESHNCFLPGQPKADWSTYEGTQTPTAVQVFIEECAHFRADMKHAHDDQVDAWAQMVNFTRTVGGPIRVARSTVRGDFTRSWATHRGDVGGGVL